MSKKCLNCGTELPDSASFCPSCTQVQIGKRTVKEPRVWRRKTIAAAVVAVLFIFCAFAASRLASPKTYEGGAELLYKDGGVEYSLFLSLNMEGSLQAEASSTIPQGAEYAFPSQLYIYKKVNEADAVDIADVVDASDEFMSKVESYSVRTEPEDGAEPMNFTSPAYDGSFPGAAFTSHIRYNADCGTNAVIWTLNMKNGDVIYLRQAIHVFLQPSIDYYPENVPMDTLEELQALLDEIDAKVDPDTVVNIYLPPVTYDGGITMKKRVYTLFGGSDGENRTTFSGPVEIATNRPHFSSIYGVCFIGNGGTGLSADESVILYDCVFKGWDMGAIAKDGAWIAAHGCSFADNRVGLQFDTRHSSFSGPTYNNDSFEGNETAILIAALHGNEILSFPGCVFSGNSADIQNPAEHPIDISGAVFK